MLDFIKQPWTWWISGMVISAIMFLLLFFGKSFGFSSNLRTLCAISGAGKKVKFFDFDWKKQTWNLVFLFGAIIGGFLVNQYLSTDAPVQIAKTTVRDLKEIGFNEPTGIQPNELFSFEAVFTLKGFLLLAVGGLFVGFGARYAGGCTSGHAISGISNLQVPSILAVVGFFIGGIIMTYFLLPVLF